jgi:branched-chain amino acid transport system ATP-binding protein
VTAPLLALSNLQILYDRVIEAVRDISLVVPEGRIIALLGSNGAGKSTVLKAVSGVLEREDGEIIHGSIEFAGEVITRAKAHHIVRHGLVQVPEGRSLFPTLTVVDNLLMGGYAQDARQSKADLDRVYGLFPRVFERRDQIAGYLSGGEQQMVAVARALAGDVRLLLLDEPFEGLSPAITEELFEAFNRLRYEIAMVIVDHHLDLALALSDRTVILERGSVSWTGQSKLLRDDLELRRQKLWM